MGSEDGVRVRVCATGTRVRQRRGDARHGYANGGNVVGKMTWSAPASCTTRWRESLTRRRRASCARQVGIGFGGVFGQRSINGGGRAAGEFPALEPTRARTSDKRGGCWRGNARAVRRRGRCARSEVGTWTLTRCIRSQRWPRGGGGTLILQRTIDEEEVRRGLRIRERRILADEMGLGKTVEVIMLVLANRLGVERSGLRRSRRTSEQTVRRRRM